MLTPQQIAALTTAVQVASPEPVLNAGAMRVGSAQLTYPFLPAASNIIERKAMAFFQPFNANINPPSAPAVSEMSDYLALSASSHVFDGWRYLSQASLSLLNGARNEALHLAYYGELRAAMSILSASGICILKNKHFSINQAGSVHWFTGGTHEVAWEALAQWIQLAPNAHAVTQSLGYLGIAAEEWASGVQAHANAAAISEAWLLDWSMDLASVTADREARNESSYRPDLRATALEPARFSEFTFVHKLSSCCEFSGNGEFDSLDMALIGHLCYCAQEQIYLPTDPHREQIWSHLEHWLLNDKGFPAPYASEQVARLRDGPNSDGGFLIKEAEATNDGPTGVMSRAFLLLRLASALQRKSWTTMRQRAAAGQLPWQRTLLSGYGEYCHLFESGSAPANFSLLDDDRRDGYTDLSGSLAAIAGFKSFQIWRDFSSAIIKLSRLERVGLLAVA